MCLLARQLARPVKWTSDRMEDLCATYQGFDEIVDAELGVDADGHILGLRADVVGDIGAYSIYPWTAALEPVQVISFMPGPYRVPAYRGRVRGVCTSKSPGGPYRGVGRPTSTFVMERLVDMAARKLGLDPRDMRRRNLVKPEEFPYKTPSGIVWDQSAFMESLERACAGVDYDALRTAQAAARAEGRWVGIGLASYAELTGIGSRIAASPGMPINTGTESATIRIDSTGGVTAIFGVSSHGQGLETTLAQVVADELGARLEDIRIVQGDSAAVAHGTGTYASRSAVLGGGAATLASRGLKEKIVRVAAHLLEASAVDIEVDRRRGARGRHRPQAHLQRNRPRACIPKWAACRPEVREQLEDTKSYDPYFGTTTSATHVAQVEIDPGTLAVEVKRYVVAEDCGRIINPLIVDGQVHGAVAQGVGVALLEEMIYDESGQILTASLADYIVPVGDRSARHGDRPYRSRVAGHAGRLPRHGRGRHHRRARGHRQRHRRRARAARHRDQRTAGHAGAPLPGAPGRRREKLEDNTMDAGVKGKVVLVTGGGRDVGRAITLAYAREGAIVAVNYNSSAKEAEGRRRGSEGAGGDGARVPVRRRRQRVGEAHGGRGDEGLRPHRRAGEQRRLHQAPALCRHHARGLEEADRRGTLRRRSTPATRCCRT